MRGTAGQRRPDHKTIIRPLPCHVRPRSRARQPPDRPAKARQRAGHTAAGHHAAAATICTKCSKCSQILQAYGEKWMSASAAGKRRVLGQSNAHLTCTQGTWRPTDVVRATHGQPTRPSTVDGCSCARLLTGCTCHARVRQRFANPKKRRHAHEWRACRRLFGCGIP